MLWILVLHIVAVLSWCAAQLYLPVLIASLSSGNEKQASSITSTGTLPAMPSDIPRLLPRFVFTRISTPAALIAIVSGTAIFVLNRTMEAWFFAKLGLVAVLVMTHALTGWLLLHAEIRPGRRTVLTCRVLSVVLAVLMSMIIWLVLAKPLPAFMD
jgi:protoporphyrinogen IX oxidase